MPGGEDIAKRYALFEAKLPASAKVGKISMKEVRSWKYVNDVQAIMATWIWDNPSPVLATSSCVQANRCPPILRG